MNRSLVAPPTSFNFNVKSKDGLAPGCFELGTTWYCASIGAHALASAAPKCCVFHNFCNLSCPYEKVTVD